MDSAPLIEQQCLAKLVDAAASVKLHRTAMAHQKRPYQMRKRAELQERTRRRITESTVELHEKLGPASTSISAVAQHAGVRRSTVYRHFPDESALFEACTAHWMAANPLPDLEPWAAIDDPEERLAAALGELYAYYGRTAPMLEHLIRDETVNATVERLFGGFRRFLEAASETLMAGRAARHRRRRLIRAAIGHAVAFTTWRSLTGEQGLDSADARELMCRLVSAAGAPGRRGRAKQSPPLTRPAGSSKPV
jgi:AcrR family transcriptional regulator